MLEGGLVNGGIVANKSSVASSNEAILTALEFRKNSSVTRYALAVEKVALPRG